MSCWHLLYVVCTRQTLPASLGQQLAVTLLCPLFRVYCQGLMGGKYIKLWAQDFDWEEMMGNINYCWEKLTLTRNIRRSVPGLIHEQIYMHWIIGVKINAPVQVVILTTLRPNPSNKYTHQHPERLKVIAHSESRKYCQSRPKHAMMGSEKILFAWSFKGSKINFARLAVAQQAIF